MPFSHTGLNIWELQDGESDKKSEKLRTIPIDNEFTIWFIIFLS